ncbi:MAG: transglycosylase domain-containing protein [Candidatus Methylacidiphilales bacterium]
MFRSRTWFGFLIKVCSFLFILGVGAGAVGFAYYYTRAASIDLDVVEKMAQTSIVYDARGKPIGQFSLENRINIAQDKPLPQRLVQAVVAKEDRRYFNHGGVDFYGVARAVVAALIPGGVQQGASTITQQLARNSINRFDKNMDRKLLEMFLAWRIERQYTKEEILRLYLNRIFFSHGMYGVETASRAFFGKSVDKLTTGECAMLAGMIASPNNYSPWTDYKKAILARDRALKQMERSGYITAAERQKIEKEQIALRPRLAMPGGSYELDAIRREVEAIFSSSTEIKTGGLRISTTLDPAVQQVAQRSLDEKLAAIEDLAATKKLRAQESAAAHKDKQKDKDGANGAAASSEKLTSNDDDGADQAKLQGAVVVMDPNSGAVRAIVGGRDYKTSPLNRAIDTRRQVGSTLKPLIYACAFAEHKLNPASWIEATTFNLAKPIPMSSSNPKVLRVNEALARSDNYAAVRAGALVGPETLVYYAQKVGITSGMPPYNSTYLGACDISVMEMAGVYSTFAAGGTYNKPFLVVQVQDSDGTVRYQHEAAPTPVFTPQVARQVTGMMETGVDFGTGESLRSKFKFKSHAAGKTGTTNDYKDAWFIGFTSSLVTAVWTGYDRPRTITPGGYGAKVALPIWADVMTYSEKIYPNDAFITPSDMEILEIDGGPYSSMGRQSVYVSATDAVPGDPNLRALRSVEDVPVRRETQPRRRNWFQRLFD